MPFYKRDGEELMVAPNFVRAPTFDLFAETHTENTYPIDGWYWFDTLDEAMTNLRSTPVSVTPRQAKTALYRAGLYDAALAAVNAAGFEAQLTWNESTAFERDSALLNSMAAALGLSQTQLDELFAVAATISA